MLQILMILIQVQILKLITIILKHKKKLLERQVKKEKALINIKQKVLNHLQILKKAKMNRLLTFPKIKILTKKIKRIQLSEILLKNPF